MCGREGRGGKCPMNVCVSECVHRFASRFIVSIPFITMATTTLSVYTLYNKHNHSFIETLSLSLSLQ